jgi:hypothetical protein
MIQTKADSGATDRALGSSSNWPEKHEASLRVCTALLLVIPCIWQPHIETVDLPSHVYNAWLASLIAHGQITGLRLVHPLTNVLADWILSAGFSAFGPAWAARILCVAAVEAFFWGTFRFVSVVNGKSAWMMAPCLAMLAYGHTFYFGFMNFYLASACAVWMLALLWRFSFGRLWLAAGIGVLGILAHPLPIAWAACAIGYEHLGRRIPIRRRPMLLAAGAAALIAIHFVLAKLFVCHWSFDQFARPGAAGFTCVGQFVPFGMKYLLVCAGLLVLWFLLFVERMDRAPLLDDPIAHLWLLNVLAVLVLPSAIAFPGYAADMQLIEERVSFFVVVLFFAVVGTSRHGKTYARMFSALAAIYFIFLYLDARALNGADRELTSLVHQLPRGQRVVASVTDKGARLNGLDHVLDWACIGWCFDYGNYEPSSLQFRVQATGPNEVVTPVNRTSLLIKLHTHVVTREEAPLYSVCPSEAPGRRFSLRKLEAGDRTCHFSLAVTPEFYRWSDEGL